VEESLKLTSEAVGRDEFDTASKLAGMASAAARKSRDHDLIERAGAARQEVDSIAAAYESLSEALATLEGEPTHAEANLQVGRFRCLLKGDWDKGLPMLALGSDQALQELARRELAGPADHLEQARLADSWWELSEKEDGVLKTRMQQRAGFWYAQAVPKLSGLAKVRAIKRMEMITGALPSPGTKPGTIEGVILLLTFDQGTMRQEGDTVVVGDASGSNHHGQLSDGKLAQGVVGYALDLDGRRTVLHLPTLRDHLVRDLQAVTVACWLYRRKAGTVFDVGGDHRRLFLFDNKFGFGIVDYAPTSPDPPDGTWYHVAGTWDGSKQVLYVNGAPMDARDRGEPQYGAVLSEKSIRSEKARIGQQAKSYRRSGRNFGGLIDEFVILSRALSPEEIRHLYEMGRKGQSLK
jgi:hypothetical protein